MRIRNFLIAAAVVAATAAPGVAQLSAANAAWAKGPEQFLMTNDEKAAWAKVTSDDAAAAFIKDFWARRDPTPGTPQNEYRDQFDAKKDAERLLFSILAWNQGCINRPCPLAQPHETTFAATRAGIRARWSCRARRSDAALGTPCPG